MKIKIDENLRVELINASHSELIFEMVENNRAHLREWLPFVDRMKNVQFADNFVNETMQRNKGGIEYAFVIFESGIAIGRIGVYKIDHQNKIGEIGYWLVKNMQGKGIITRTCKTIIDFCFINLDLNRIEIKCGKENLKSKTIAEKLNFSNEGIIRQGELLHEKFIDLNLYSLLKEEISDNSFSKGG
jgi:ribosomal-protein-serine acetyltransferase